MCPVELRRLFMPSLNFRVADFARYIFIPIGNRAVVDKIAAFLYNRL